MKRIFILLVAVGLVCFINSVNAEIYIKGPVWYNETCNSMAYGDIKEISVSGNHVGVATECNCNPTLPKNCNGLFLFNISTANLSNVPEPFVYSISTTEWFESVQVNGKRAVSGSSSGNLDYFEISETQGWYKKWTKKLSGTVVSVYLSGNYIAAGSEKDIYLLDTAANEKWKKSIESKVIKVAIVDNKVIAATYNYIYMYDISGDLIKEIRINAKIESIYASEGLIAVGADKVYLYDADGNEKWVSETKGIIKTIHFADGKLAAGTLNNKIYIFNLDEGGKLHTQYITNSPVWSINIAGDYVTAGTTGRTTYFINTEGELKWKYESDAGGNVRSTGVCSVYNSGSYVYVGGWGKKLYLFESGKVLVDDEIERITGMLDSLSERMNITAEEELLKLAKEEEIANNYPGVIAYTKEIEEKIKKDIEHKISDSEELLNEINNEIDREKYISLAETLDAAGLEIEEAKELFSEGKYSDAVRITNKVEKEIYEEIEKIIEKIETTIEDTEDWNMKKLEEIFGPLPEYAFMEHHEKVVLVTGLMAEIEDEVKLTDAKTDLTNAINALEEKEYIKAIEYSKEVIIKIEEKVDEVIKESQHEIKKIREFPLVFKVDTSHADQEMEIGVNRTRYKDCGIPDEFCPDYSAAIFWAKHAEESANADKTITIMKNAAILVIILLLGYFLYIWRKGKSDKEEGAGKDTGGEAGGEAKEVEKAKEASGDKDK